ncbi:hypothetical protein HPB49_003742 [Dermacentor silvarum]|uniref:Uncharacterized protein n=1 Tax=Dermacentor silvarum TaxID=543639 RepID=A0ACB8CD72_DERSI|nr:hypothetical protein HPB49_003742 [Dermacentor silvarum]
MLRRLEKARFHGEIMASVVESQIREVSPGHLVLASLLSAPAGLAASALLHPEIDQPEVVYGVTSLTQGGGGLRLVGRPRYFGWLSAVSLLSPENAPPPRKFRSFACFFFAMSDWDIFQPSSAWCEKHALGAVSRGTMVTLLMVGSIAVNIIGFRVFMEVTNQLLIWISSTVGLPLFSFELWCAFGNVGRKVTTRKPTAAPARRRWHQPTETPAMLALHHRCRRKPAVETQTPRLHYEDLVVVLKSRGTLDLKASFKHGDIGSAVAHYVGELACGDLSVWPVWDQNTVVCGTESTQVASTSRLFWREGEIAFVRKLGTRNVAVVTFVGRRLPPYIPDNHDCVPVRAYKKTIPACYRCGTIGHRVDNCPHPDDGRCGFCGQQVSITPAGLNEHECKPICMICGEAHLTGSAQCTGKFRKLCRPWSQSGGATSMQSQRTDQPPRDRKLNKSGQAPQQQTSKTGKPGQGALQKKTPKNEQCGTGTKPPAFKAGDFPPLSKGPTKQVSNWAGVTSQSSPASTLTPSPIDNGLRVEL